MITPSERISRHLRASFIIGISLFSFSIVSNAYAADNAKFVSQYVPSSMKPGEITQVVVTMKNTGTTTWGSNYKLGSQNPEDNTIWGLNRVKMWGSVPPGKSYTFMIIAKAPLVPGTYNFQWRMVNENTSNSLWFGDSNAHSNL